MKKYLVLALCTMLSIGLITGCGSKKEEKKENDEEIIEEKSNEVIGCDGCVYAVYFSSKNYAGDERSVLTDYVTDYRELKNKNGDQYNSFLGHILDENGYIVRGFACGIYDDKVFCLEGTTDGSKFEENVKIGKQIYGEENCNDWVNCRRNKPESSVIIRKEGSVEVKPSSSNFSCDVTNHGWMLCYDY